MSDKIICIDQIIARWNHEGVGHVLLAATPNEEWLGPPGKANDRCIPRMDPRIQPQGRKVYGSRLEFRYSRIVSRSSWRVSSWSGVELIVGFVEGRF